MKIAEFKVEEWMNKYESSALYDLTTTCIKPLSVAELFQILPEEILRFKLTYGDITGSERLKCAIKSLYKNQNANNITVTHGAIGANHLVYLTLLEKNDEVVSVVPTYQQHYSIPESLGAKVNLLFLKEENNWLPDLDELNSKVNMNTKIIALNNPNNPTGAVIPEDMMKQIIEIARKNDCWILCDEAYRGLNLFGNPYSDSVADIYEKGISVGSMSKTYSLPGLRLGWIVADEVLVSKINSHRQYNTISVGVIDDYIASVALENGEWIKERNFEILNSGYNILKKWLKEETRVNCILPKGATTVLVRYNLNIPSKEFCYNLQKQTGVALLPGETMEMEGFFRLGFCADNLEKALNLISENIDKIV